MGLLEDLKSGKYNLVFISILFLFVFHQYWNKVEPMTNSSNEEIIKLIYDTYKIDVTAIKNLVEIATKLQNENGLTTPGNLTIPGKLNIGSNAKSKDLPEGVTASVDHTTGDSTLRLKTKNDDTKNIHLVNSDGNFKLKNSNVEVFGINKNGDATFTGNASVEHTIGDSSLRLKTKNDDTKNIHLVNSDGNFKLKNSNVEVFGINKNGDAAFTGNVLGKQNRARYIRVGNKNSDLSKDMWSLIELRAYDRDGKNVTLNKKVSIIEGRPYDSTFNPDSITDNKIFDLNNTERDDNMLFGYHGSTGINLLEIDLDTETELSNIVLFNRWNVNRSSTNEPIDTRMDGTTVEFLGADRKINRIIHTGLWHRQYSKEYVF